MERILFTGLGSIGRRHLRLLRERDESFDVHAYRSGESSAETPECVTEHTELSVALATEPDLAFVTNPPALHVPTAVECARAGCDLFVEKPLSDSMDGIDDLIDLAARNDLVTYVGCQFRFSPLLQDVEHVLETGRLGMPLSFRAYSGSYLPDWRNDRDYRDTYSASASLGGGVVLDLIHEFDYVHWLFGAATRVASEVGQLSSLDVAVEDVAEVVLRTDGGIIGNVHVDYVRRPSRRTLEVTAEDGTLEADLLEKTVRIHEDGGPETRTYDYDRDDLFRRQLEYFLANCRTREPCTNDLQEGKAVLDTVLRVKGGR